MYQMILIMSRLLPNVGLHRQPWQLSLQKPGKLVANCWNKIYGNGGLSWEPAGLFFANVAMQAGIGQGIIL
jgi:hypothetical protein